MCGKGLYSLKNAHGKVLKKKYNSIQLKIYEERQGHAAASDEDIESKIELDGTNSHNEESASKERSDVTDSHNDIDTFCQWILDSKVCNEDGLTLDSLRLTSKPDLSVCASASLIIGIPQPNNCSVNEAKKIAMKKRKAERLLVMKR